MACGTLGTDANQVIAISTAAPNSLEEYDTLTPQAAALNATGDTVRTATILWASLDSVLTVLNDATGRTVVQHPGLTGRLQARVGTLISNPLTIRALAAADTVFATGATADTVSLSVDSLSDSLAVELADTLESASGGASLTVPLAGRPVVYTITHPAAPDSITLVRVDTSHAVVGIDTVATGSSGVAVVKVRLLGGPLPDSVVVTASAQRAVGTIVPGSPVTFVVRFQP